MKKIKCLISAAALMAMASCSSDKYEGPEAPNFSPDNVAYAKLNITMASLGSRAGEDNLGSVGSDFMNGTDVENTVKSVFAVFYNKAGNVVGKGTATDFTSTGSVSGGNVSNTVKLQVILNEGSSAAEASSVVAFVNYGDATVDVASMTLSQLKSQGLVKSADLTTKIDNTEYFKMTNSGYYDEAGNYILETACSGALYLLDDDKTADEKAPAIDVYVERLASKVQLLAVNKIAKKTVYTVSAPETQIELTFVPEAWDVTATAKNMYAVKYMPATNATLATNQWMYKNTSTSGAGQFRSYWAFGPSYSNKEIQNAFPVSGNVVPEETLLDYVTQGTAKNKFKDLWTNTTDSWTPNENTVNYAYTPENTFSGEVLNSLVNPFTATTAIVIEGGYTVTGYTEGFYLRTINGKTYIYKEDEAIDALVNNVKANFKVGTTTGDAVEITKNDVDFTPVAGCAANAYYIQLKAPAENKKYFSNLTGEWTEVTEIADVNDTYFRKLIGSMNYYMNGKGFYYIPLKHYYDGSTKDAMLSAIATGNYGVVRNNWYALTVNSIDGFASGFGDPQDQPGTKPGTDPTIPDLPQLEDSQEYGLNVSMKVLQWHMRNQDVNL